MVVPAGSRVLGRLLIACGAASESDIANAVVEQRATRERIGEVLIRHGVDPGHVARCLADQLRLPYVEAPFEPDSLALRLVDGGLAVRLRTLPLRASERGLTVAMADPLDARAVDDLQFQTGRRVQPSVAIPAAVDAALARMYGASAVSAILARIPANGTVAHETDEAALRRASDAAPIVALVDLILQRAVDAHASDIHVEPGSPRLRVRARIDGVLRELLVLPEHAAGAIVSRIKVMANLDIATKRRPQDGRATVVAAGREITLRVSTLPSVTGEKAVLRVLDTQADRTLEELGLPVDMRARLNLLLARGNGVVLVTGPTGSGKTTTLYAALSALDRERRNIVTLEDPVEYRLSGLTQVQVHRKAGLGFSAGLRAVLRQDPDVIMVGEMRDRETAEIAMSAALTGHLVLSTMHTTDSAAAVTRLLEMGTPPYLIAGALIGVVAQRLVRRLCPACALPANASGLPAPEERAGSRIMHAVGCNRCEEGYRGRIGVYELLDVDTRVRELILHRGSEDAIRTAGRASGMRSMSEDCIDKVRAGITTAEEVRTAGFQ
jgi:type IV pilus assembly protein PilB